MRLLSGVSSGAVASGLLLTATSIAGSAAGSAADLPAVPAVHVGAPTADPAIASPAGGVSGPAGGNVVVSLPPVVFTAESGWANDLQRGRPALAVLRFAAGPGVSVSDVSVSAGGGSVDCPADQRSTRAYVTSVPCRLQPGVPAVPGEGDQVRVRLTVTTDAGTFAHEYGHAVVNGPS